MLEIPYLVYKFPVLIVLYNNIPPTITAKLPIVIAMLVKTTLYFSISSFYIFFFIIKYPPPIPTPIIPTPITADAINMFCVFLSIIYIII